MNLRLAIFKPMLKIAMERTGHGAALGFQLTKVGRGEVEMTFPIKKK
jgi:acyl-coenzyme A thioesterase PaaI-like protein